MDSKAIWGSLGQDFLRGVHYHQSPSGYQNDFNKDAEAKGQTILDTFMPSNGEFSREQRAQQAQQLRQLMREVKAERANRGGQSH